MPFAAGLGYAAAALSACGSLYMFAAGPVTRGFFRRAMAVTTNFPPVTIYKPLHGAPPHLHDDLASFFTQDYPGAVQILFGVHDANDPAIAIVEALKHDHPNADAELVIDARVHGSNPKISNLINMAARAKHGVFLLSDADIRVAPDFLKDIVATLAPPGTGAVTCCYSGSGEGFWPRFASQDIGARFLPNAVMGLALHLAHPCFGSAIALGRETYDRIGGFGRLANVLADDYELGRAVRSLGLMVAVPPLLVNHDCSEATFRDVVTHELRWARTVRTVDPLGHAGSGLTHPTAWALLALFCLGFNLFAAGILAVALLSRTVLKWHIDAVTARNQGPTWLLPLRDVTSFGVYLASLFGRSVQWQDLRFRVKRAGTLSES